MSSMRLLAVVAGFGAMLGAAGPERAVAASASAGQGDAHPAHWKTIEDHCLKCHNTEDWAGSLAFDTMSPDDVPKDSKVWETTIKKLRRSSWTRPPARAW
jgi:hypothetical protein